MNEPLGVQAPQATEDFLDWLHEQLALAEALLNEGVEDLRAHCESKMLPVETEGRSE